MSVTVGAAEATNKMSSARQEKGQILCATTKRGASILDRGLIANLIMRGARVHLKRAYVWQLRRIFDPAATMSKCAENAERLSGDGE